MKFGQQLERDSVPEWSLHNVDYNSLKREIKVHTTKDQGTAIAIPGQPDVALSKFEDALFRELVLQHDRVDLFVNSKASEITRRLDHLRTSIHRFAVKSADQGEGTSVLRRQRRYVKYERDLLHCDGDIHALSRFCSAQVVAFRKILKKYKKWTGSSALHTRINQDVLGNPRSFTRKHFDELQVTHDELLSELRTAEPPLSEPSSPESINVGSQGTVRQAHLERAPFHELPQAAVQQTYWNEYDNGSEAGEDDGYAIYINPNEDSSAFPGLDYVTAPFRTVSKWFRPNGSNEPERAPLLSDDRSRSAGYSSTSAHTDSEEEGYASSDGIPTEGFTTHYAAFPSVDDQRVKIFRGKALLYGTIGSLVTSFVLLGICSVLIATGRHRLRVEVDAGVTLGVVMSLFCSCSALTMMLYRNDHMSVLFRMVVWCSVITSFVLNGMLLVLVANNAP